MITVALVDDQHLVREGIAGLLGLSGKITTLWQSSNGIDAIDKIKKYPVDIILADIRMPIMNGIDMVKNLRDKNINTPVLMLTTFDDDDLCNQSFEAGANGFLLKDETLDNLIEVIQKAVKGENINMPALSKKQEKAIIRHTKRIHLTERESQILRFLAAGQTNKEISKSVFLAEGTVRNHISNLLEKFECRDRTQVALKAISLNYV